MRSFYAVSDREIENGIHIVFIHGLGGDPETSWIREEFAQIFDWSRNLESEFDWIKVWKFKHKISLRKTCFYSSDVNKVASKLIKKIKKKKLIDTGNIIFVVHSLGGIISKILIKELNERKNNKEYLEILKQVKGVVSLSTPHNGSKLADVAKEIVSGLWPICILKYIFNKKIVCQLKPDNKFLEEIDQEYEHLCSKYNFEHVEFLESIKTNIKKHASKKVFYKFLFFSKRIEKKLKRFNITQNSDYFVEKHRNKINNIAIKQIIPINEDHFTICKPKNKIYDVYQHTLFLSEKVYTVSN